jgi:hypothetical protein
MSGRAKHVPVVNQGHCWLCPSAPTTRGYCEKHYRELLHSGELVSARARKTLGTCKSPECSHQETRKFAGYCQACYTRNYKKKKMAERLASGDIPAKVGRRGNAGILAIMEEGGING